MYAQLLETSGISQSGAYLWYTILGVGRRGGAPHRLRSCGLIVVIPISRISPPSQQFTKNSHGHSSTYSVLPALAFASLKNR